MTTHRRGDHLFWSTRCDRDGGPGATDVQEMPRSPRPRHSYAEQIRDLLMGCGRGEVTELGGLYDETIDWIYPLARRMSRDDESAALLTQDAYQRIWIASPQFDPASTCAVSWVGRQLRGQLTAAHSGGG